MILIALGANLPSHAGTPAENVRAALGVLERKGIRPVTISPLYASPAWPDPNDPEYVNGVASVETSLEPQALIVCLHEVESLFGRTRNEKNAPRPLDLDILDYAGRICAANPVLPHPRLQTRAFVLLPLRDVAPDWHHPVSGKSVSELIATLPQPDCDSVRPLGLQT